MHTSCQYVIWRTVPSRILLTVLQAYSTRCVAASLIDIPFDGRACTKAGLHQNQFITTVRSAPGAACRGFQQWRWRRWRSPKCKKTKSTSTVEVLVPLFICCTIAQILLLLLLVASVKRSNKVGLPLKMSSKKNLPSGQKTRQPSAGRNYNRKRACAERTCKYPRNGPRSVLYW